MGWEESIGRGSGGVLAGALFAGFVAGSEGGSLLGAGLVGLLNVIVSLKCISL